MSWLNPLPEDAPYVLPKWRPKVIAPSFIKENGQVLNLLMHHGRGDVKDYSDLNLSIVSYVAWLDGRWGWCLDFNGIDRSLTIPLDIRGYTSLTVEMWARLLSTAQADRAVVNWRAGAMALRWAEPDSLIFYLTTENGTVSVSYTLPIGDWHHIVGRWDGSTVRLMVDGVEVGTPAALTGSITYTSWVGNYYCWLGRERGGASPYVAGQQALVRVYNIDKGANYVRRSFEKTRILFGV